MTLSASVSRLLLTVLLVSPAIHAQSQPSEEPNFPVEIQAAAEGGPKFMVTNHTSRTLTAWVIRISSSSSKKDQGTQIWDTFIQDQEAPFQPNASTTHYLSHIVGAPLPDKVEVIAGVWADGEAFGEPNWVKMILANREKEAAANESAAALLQKGLDQNWTREQYLEALSDMPTSGAIVALRSTLLGNRNFDKPQLLRHSMQTMLDIFIGKSIRLRSAKPRPAVTSSSGKSSNRHAIFLIHLYAVPTLWRYPPRQVS